VAGRKAGTKRVQHGSPEADRDREMQGISSWTDSYIVLFAKLYWSDQIKRYWTCGLCRVYLGDGKRHWGDVETYGRIILKWVTRL
jgi:hypothetical protein